MTKTKSKTVLTFAGVTGTTREIAARLEISYEDLLNELQKLGGVKSLGTRVVEKVWVEPSPLSPMPCRSCGVVFDRSHPSQSSCSTNCRTALNLASRKRS